VETGGRRGERTKRAIPPQINKSAQIKRKQMRSPLLRRLSTQIGKPSPLLTPEFIERNHGLITPIDGTWHLPTTVRDARAEFDKCHLRGARFFDIDACAADSSLPHMLPTADVFAGYMGERLGVGDGDHVVVYDSHGISSATRVWWTMRVFGHDKVSVMDGGLPRWVAERRAVTNESTQIKVRLEMRQCSWKRPSFTSQRNPTWHLCVVLMRWLILCAQALRKFWMRGLLDGTIPCLSL